MAAYQLTVEEKNLFKLICELTNRQRLDPLPDGLEVDSQYVQAIHRTGVKVERLQEWWEEPVGGPHVVRDPRGIDTLSSLMNNNIGRGYIEYVNNQPVYKRLQLTELGLREANKLFGPLRPAAVAPVPQATQATNEAATPVAAKPEPVEAKEPSKRTGPRGTYKTKMPEAAPVPGGEA